MDVNVRDFSLWNGMMMSFCAWIICGAVNVVCHSGINGYNPCRWNLSIMSDSWVVVIIPMSWSGMASIWIMMTWAAVSVGTWLWPGMTSPVSVLVAVSRAWHSMVAFMWFELVVFCWGSQRRYPVWIIHCNVTILIIFETPNVRANFCYMSLLLALKKAIFIIWHHADHRWRSDGGSQLLYSVKLFDFEYCITEHFSNH